MNSRWSDPEKMQTRRGKSEPTKLVIWRDDRSEPMLSIES